MKPGQTSLVSVFRTLFGQALDLIVAVRQVGNRTPVWAYSAVAKRQASPRRRRSRRGRR